MHQSDEKSQSWNEYKREHKHGLSSHKHTIIITLICLVTGCFGAYWLAKRSGFIMDRTAAERAGDLAYALNDRDNIRLCLWSDASTRKIDTGVRNVELTEYNQLICTTLRPGDVTHQDTTVMVHAYFEQATLTPKGQLQFPLEGTQDECESVGQHTVLYDGMVGAMCFHAGEAVEELAGNHWSSDFGSTYYTQELEFQIHIYDRNHQLIRQPTSFYARTCVADNREYNADGSYAIEPIYY